MVHTIFIPDQVKDAIRKHLSEAISKGIKGYESAFEDEDTFTGHLFGLMKIDEQIVKIDNVEIEGNWKWAIDYKKFGGRGKGATESLIGADGIFELSLHQGNEERKKSLLFQSKLDWKGKDKKLYQQCAKLMTWLGAATIVNYTQEDIEAYSLDEILANQGSKAGKGKPFAQLLGEDFINCDIGDNDLEYDAQKKKLTWLDSKNEIVSIKFNLNRRLKIKVTAPGQKSYLNSREAKLIQAGDLPKHPLKTEFVQDSIRGLRSIKELDKMRRKFSKAFHPDKHLALSPAEVSLFNELMKQLNNEVDRQKVRINDAEKK